MRPAPTSAPFHLIALFIAGTACAKQDDSRPVTDSALAAGTASASADSSRAAAPSPAAPWTVTPAGIGQVRVGMTVDELRGMAGDVALPAGGGTECTYVRPAGMPRGVSVMLAGGRVARIDVDSSGVQSDGGVAVGDSASRVETAYAGRVSTMPHKYVAGGQYFTVKPISSADSALRIVFEAEGGRITRFRSGRVPEVEFVERCG